MTTFEDAKPLDEDVVEDKEMKKEDDINDWPCPLTDDMKKMMHDSFKVVKKDK